MASTCNAMAAISSCWTRAKNVMIKLLRQHQYIGEIAFAIPVALFSMIVATIIPLHASDFTQKKQQQQPQQHQQQLQRRPQQVQRVQQLVQQRQQQQPSPHHHQQQQVQQQLQRQHFNQQAKYQNKLNHGFSSNSLKN